MRQLLNWVRQLGNAGAIHNARALFDQRQADDVAVQALDLRVTTTRGRAA